MTVYINGVSKGVMPDDMLLGNQDGVFGRAYFDGEWIVLWQPVLSSGQSKLRTLKTWGYGTYQWWGKITTPDVNFTQQIGFGGLGETAHAIQVRHNGSNYQFITNDGTNLSTTNLTGQDWTVARKFRIEWAADSCKLFVDDVEEAHHTSYVPSVPLFKVMECSHSMPITSEFYIYTKGLLP